MLRRAACLLILLLPCAVAAWAQPRTEERALQPRILLLLDGSSSMLQPWNNTIRFKAAGKIVAALMDSIYAVNESVEFGLRVYGHQSPAQLNDCFDSRMEVMFSKNNAVQMGLRLASLHPFGVSPIAYSLKEAAENDLVDEVRNAYSVILITDGGESCGGNICDVVKTLIERKISFKPYIISLVNHTPLKDQYACLGTYLQVAKESEMGPAINKIVEDYRPLLSMPIMSVRTEPATPGKPQVTIVRIPAWVPDRSSVATLTIKVPAAAGLPVTSMNRAAPRPVRVPPPTPVSPPPPAPVLVRPEDFLEVVTSNSRPARMSIRHSRPLPRRQPLPQPTPVTRSIPEPMPVQEALAVLRNAPRPALVALTYTAPRPLAVPVPPPAPVTRALPEPEAIIALSRNARPALLSTPYLLPMPNRIAVPAPAPVVRSLPEPEILAAIRTGAGPATFSLRYSRPLPRRVAVPRPEPVTRAIPEPESFAAISSSTRPRLLTINRTGPLVRRVPVPRPAAVTRSLPEPASPAAVVRRDTVAATRPNPPATARVPDTLKSSVVIKKMDPPVTTVTPKRTPAQPAKQTPGTPKETTFTTETEEAKETNLAILFTDGRGKFYASTPQLQLTDAATGKLVKQFYRTVDAAGNPDPQTIPPGTYNLLVAGRANMLMRRIVVEKNKTNRIIVKVTHGSLRFRYEDAPDRPVTEFEAIVNIRFEPGPTVKQRCTAELEYAPGNYYIEINTMPISRFNTDIDFGAITEIQIPQSGYVQFVNTAPLGTISLFTPLGNKFVRFHGLRITGNPEDQRLRLKPGLYEVHWVKNPSQPFAPEIIDRFTIKSNSVTEVELR